MPKGQPVHQPVTAGTLYRLPAEMDSPVYVGTIQPDKVHVDQYIEDKT